jgi:hypothetical protein
MNKVLYKVILVSSLSHCMFNNYNYSHMNFLTHFYMIFFNKKNIFRLFSIFIDIKTFL